MPHKDKFREEEGIRKQIRPFHSTATFIGIGFIQLFIQLQSGYAARMMEVSMSDNIDNAASGRQTKRIPAIDLKSMSAGQLRELIAEAQVELITKQETAKTDLLTKWQAEAEEAGLTFNEVTAAGTPKGKDRSGTISKAAVKYRGPNGDEWSGRGRLPKWVKVAEAEGKSRENFKV